MVYTNVYHARDLPARPSPQSQGVCYAFVGGDNAFAEMPPKTPRPTPDAWQIWGGHRMWIAPEAKPKTYAPDNAPVTVAKLANGVRLTAPVETLTGVQKEMQVTLDSTGTRVTVVHRMTNKGLFPIELAPWALSVMNGGGVAILPQEPFAAHPAVLEPVRPLALWSYTDLTAAAAPGSDRPVPIYRLTIKR